MSNIQSSTKQKLRIGLLLQQDTIEQWAFDAVKAIEDSSHSQVVLIIKSFPKQVEDKHTKNSRLFNLLNTIESKSFKSNPNAFQLSDIKTITDCDMVSLENIQDVSNLTIISSYDLDVIFNIDIQDLAGNIKSAAKYGLWSYQHSKFNHNDDRISGVWEMFKKEYDYTTVVLNLKRNNHENLTIFSYCIANDELSILRHRNKIYWNTRLVVVRKLQELYSQGNELFFQKIENNQPLEHSNKLKKYKTPGNLEVLKGLAHIYGKSIKRVIKRKYYFDQWMLLFKFNTHNHIDYSFETFTPILPPKDRFWADPFVLFRDNTYYIFLEELLYSENIGKLSVMSIDINGNYTTPKVILEKPYHLSYPFLIEDDNELYMIPESKGDETIQLYKCQEFPLKWKLEEILFKDIVAADTTVFKYRNIFWMFTNVEKINGTKTSPHELFLFYSDQLIDGDWKEHPKNPIVNSLKHSRPAGNIYEENGRIFRPAQNCTKHYGYAMEIMEITKLTKSDYEEKQVKSLTPDFNKSLISTHTLNHDHTLTIIDGKIKRKRN